MSDTPEAVRGTPESGRASLSEDFQRTIQEVDQHVTRRLEEAAKLKVDPEGTIRDRERTVFESLEKAKNYYKKKEYARAFQEWEQVCGYLGESDEFRSKVRSLKQSHENLDKVNRELVEIKQVLYQRSSPPPSDAKFVEHAHEAASNEVKNVYSYLNQQLRTERTPRTLSFWWPVGLAFLILAAGVAGLAGFRSKLQTQAAARETDAGGAQSPLDATYLEAQRNAMEKQIGALNQDHEKQMEELRQKDAQAAKGDREKIIQLETKLNDSESKNADLERQVKALLEDNLNKDKTLASLN